MKQVQALGAALEAGQFARIDEDSVIRPGRDLVDVDDLTPAILRS